MGTECIEAMLDESEVILSVPPGFGPLTTFTLQRVEENTPTSTSTVTSTSTFNSIQTPVDAEVSTSDAGRLKKSLRHRAWVNYKDDDYSDEDLESELNEPVVRPVRKNLPKGVIRGCLECDNCQKVTAKWRPGDACRPVLDEAPVFCPTEEEFKDTLKYIAQIRPMAEPYGICRIVPPASWKPPCPLKEKDVWENSTFATRIQKVHKLQNRYSAKRLCNMMKRKRRKISKTETECGNSNEDNMNANELRFGFEPGPDFTLESFQNYANDFKKQYFQTNDGAPLPDKIEGEYWRIVENPTEEIEVLYGADLETGEFGSGFPKTSSESEEDPYVKSGWNLNNFPRLPGSILSFENGDISGVVVPWLYVGMCFSSFCWHVEDHHLFSLNYLHWGDQKVWYGVPGKDALKLEGAMKKHLPHLFEEQPDLLHNLVTQFSPSLLKKEGVPVYRCVQHEGEFVLTFPRAYHSGFNCGFNCAEAVNVAPLEWLPHGQNAVELYREQVRRISISHDKLLLGAAREAVRAQWNISFLGNKSDDYLRWKDACKVGGILVKSLKDRVELEKVRREIIGSSQSKKMDPSFDSNCERECAVCHYDLHLSAVGCSCSPDRYTCLMHVKELCSCDVSTRNFLVRYEISELNILVDAVGGKLSAVHRWGLSDLKLKLSSAISREKTPELKSSHEITDSKQSLNQAGRGPPGFSNETRGYNSNTSFRTGRPNVYSRPRILEDVRKARMGLSHYGSASENTMHNRQNIMANNKNVVVFDVDKLEAKQAVSSEKIMSANQVATSSLHHDTTVSLNSMQNRKEGISSSTDSVLFDVDKQASHAVSEEVKEHLVNGKTAVSEKVKEEPFVQNIDTATVCNPQHEQVLMKPETAVSTICETEHNLCTVKNDSNGAIASKPLVLKQESDCIIANSRSKINTNAESTEAKNGELVTLNPSCAPSIDKNIPIQRGPRMAKVVRRINCVVEPLEYGVISPGKLWSTSQAIFPKGYRSRVRYFSILDPTQMCYYLSEILDAGLLGPLFMVKVESCPSEVFINTSATKCWDMVRERLNNEIRRHHSLGKANVPTLQPPGMLDGLEMFGLTSPTIIKAIEEIDQHHNSFEYWQNRLQPSTTTKSAIIGQGTLGGSDTIIRGLFKKASPEELETLHKLLKGDYSNCKNDLICLLEEEIRGNSR